MRKLIIVLVVFLVACSGQTKEDMVQQGNALRDEGNLRGAIVYYKNALGKDANYFTARRGLAEAYLLSGQLEPAKKEFEKLRLQQPQANDILLKLAEVAIQQREPSQALLLLDEYAAAEQETAELLVLYGLAHGSQGDLQSAEKFFRQALERDPQFSDALINLAKVALQRSDFAAARQWLERVIAADAENLRAYYLLATTEARAGQPEAALAAYQAVLKIDPQQLQALAMSGQLQLDLGRLEAAEKTVAELGKRFADAPESSRLKGMLQFRQKDFAAATLTLQESLQQQANLITYFYLGLSQFAQGDFEQALGQFQKTLDLRPEFERGRLLVALTLLKQKRLEDAILEVRRLLKQNPDNALAHNILGSALLAQGHYQEGMEALEAATDLNPKLVDAYIKQGVVNFARGDQAAGEADLVAAVQAQPDMLNSRLLLVTNYLRQKNYTAAIKAIEEGLNGSDSDALLKNYQAAAYFAQKKPDLAIAALKQALEINPAYLTPYFNLASYYASQRNYAEAEAAYQAVLEQQDGNLRALTGLASLYAVQGQEDAIQATVERLAASGSEQGLQIAARYYLGKKQVDEAVKVLDQGLAVYPASAGLLELKSRVLLSREQFAAAETLLQDLAEVAPERGYSLLIQLYLGTERQTQALELSQQLLQENPNQEYPYLLAASLAAREGGAAAARAQLEKGIEQVAQPLKLRLQLGGLLAGQGQFSAAAEQFTQVLQDSPRSSAANLALATVKEQQGDKAAALDLYRRAVSFNKRNVQALNNLAYLLADNFGEGREALQFALQAYRLNPGDPRIMDTLGYVLWQNQRLEEADQLLTRARELLPEIPTVALHLAQVRLAREQTEGVRELLTEVVANGQPTEVEQADELLDALR